MPPRIRRTLNYVDSSYVRNNPGNNYLVYSFRINDLYDPDPLILSGSVSGFKEIMQFYQYYRVLVAKMVVEVSNNEAFSLFYGICFSQSNLTGVITTRDDAMNALESGFSTRPKLLAAKGGMDRARLSTQITISKLLGDAKQYQAEQSYVGIGLATPAIPLWANFIVCSPTGAALVNGYTNSTTITMTSEFFGKLNLRA